MPGAKNQATWARLKVIFIKSDLAETRKIKPRNYRPLKGEIIENNMNAVGIQACVILIVIQINYLLV